MTWISWRYVIGRTAFRTDINGNELLRRTKYPMIEVVEPKEEEEVFDCRLIWRGTVSVTSFTPRRFLHFFSPSLTILPEWFDTFYILDDILLSVALSVAVWHRCFYVTRVACYESGLCDCGFNIWSPLLCLLHNLLYPVYVFFFCGELLELRKP
jgi:hypothetical protein